MQSYISTPSVFGISYTPNVRHSTRIATDSIVRSRKTWKTLKSNKQLVWAPQVEAALIEGLEKYRPSSITDPLTLKRFPKRNRWIAEYIFRTTGQQRTAKQVGSRLQQLTNTCKDERILRLLSRREYTPEPEIPDTPTWDDAGSTLSSSTTSSPYSPCTPWEFSETSSTSSDVNYFTEKTRCGDASDEPRLSHTSVIIELTPPFTLPPPHSNSRRSSYSEDRESPTDDIGPESVPRLPVIDTTSHQITVHNFNFLPPLAPTVSFMSPILVSTSEFLSCFRVTLRGSLIFTESTEFTLESSSTHCWSDVQKSNHLYVNKFLPHFWQRLYQFEPDDIFQCSIVQQIARKDSVQRNTPEDMNEIIHAVTYCFRPSAVSTASAPTQVPSVGKEGPAVDVSTRQTNDRCSAVVHPPFVPELQLMHPDDTCVTQPGSQSNVSEGAFLNPSPFHGVVQPEVHSYENASVLPQQHLDFVNPGGDCFPPHPYPEITSMPVVRRSHSPDGLDLDSPVREYPFAIPIPPPRFAQPVPHGDTNQHQQLYMFHSRIGAPVYFWLDKNNCDPHPLVSKTGVDSISYEHNLDDCQDSCEFAQQSFVRHHQYGMY
ncbi:hypothetical protein E1B28_007086 [Marasmius oreades]|uniref:TEA domain-containing protein n=1 Tax=Marasmius oreades TaxID=181124 RepID=A0A9P7S109_9AGAR|nr:uncharacterized protein E1B28_007086 [Marasmius oreades]KAG7093404.1 hypothetical protein E1B28_007086 [Marasmius oreades]